MGQWTCALRLGSTSYLYPEDVLPNVRRLAGLVQDIEWVVFEVDHGLPPAEDIAEMARLGQVYGHSYTVHLPLKLGLAAEDEAVRCRGVETARQVIAAAAPLQPWAYVVHLEGEGSGDCWGPWHERAAESLTALGRAAGGLDRLAVENLPDYPPEHLGPLVERLPLSLTLDVGHLLRQDRDPLPVLHEHLKWTRAIHLHGFEAGRDHRPLAACDQGLLLDILRTAHRAHYAGVVTIELFGAEPFFESWDLLEGLWRRVQAESAENSEIIRNV